MQKRQKKITSPLTTNGVSKKSLTASSDLNVGHDIQGHIDLLSGNVLSGWSIDATDVFKRLKIVAMQGDKIVAETIANEFRKDLLDIGIGDGNYGFKLTLPQHLSSAGEVHVLHKDSGVPLIGSPVSLTRYTSLLDNDTKTIILIDLSDLVFYLEHHDHLTGIQRVQANIVSAIIENVIHPLTRIKVVLYSEVDMSFKELSLDRVLQLIKDTTRDVGARSLVRNPDGVLNINDFLRPHALSMSERESQNAALIMLGAAWVYPNYFYAINSIRKLGIKFIPLIHDLIPIVMPTMCDKGTAEVFKIFIKKILYSADRVLTVSHHTRVDLERYCEENNITPPQISVSYNGQNLSNDSFQDHLLPINEPYVLFVSTIEGRKNHKLAFDLWKRLYREYGNAIPKLIFIGRVGWRVENLVEELYACNFVEGKIQIFSDVSDAVLVSLYKKCLFTFYPSLYEGWGLPVGESLAFGKVCLSSNASSLPEVGGDLAIYFDPIDFDDLFDKARDLIFNIKYRISLEKKIAKTFKPFSWIDSAQRVVDSAINACCQTRAKPYPVLEIGEYSFSNIPYIDSNTVHGNDVIKFSMKMSMPLLTSKRLRIENYIFAEQCLVANEWLSGESFGRWGHLRGSSIQFKCETNTQSYILYLQIFLPEKFVSGRLEIICAGRTVDIKHLEDRMSVIKLELDNYRVENIYDLNFRLQDYVVCENSQDHRNIGIGLGRLALIDADSVSQRLDILEKLSFN